VTIDALELQLASAAQRFQALQRRAANAREPVALLTRTLAELSTALEEMRVAQEQLIESRSRAEQLQEELRLQSERYWQLFDEIPQPYVVTKTDSTIVEVNKAAAELFNVSQRFLVGKTLSVFVCEDRSGFLNRISGAAAQGAPLQFEFKLRPRERAPQLVSARVKGDEHSLRWLLEPQDQSQIAHAS
jgi:PAS domain S-box-containing protein